LKRRKISDADAEAYIGKKFRKIFDGTPFEGEVMQYFQNKNYTLFHVVYEDGDREDLSVAQLMAAL
jgi:hypothetical protein